MLTSIRKNTVGGQEINRRGGKNKNRGAMPPMPSPAGNVATLNRPFVAPTQNHHTLKLFTVLCLYDILRFDKISLNLN